MGIVLQLTPRERASARAETGASMAQRRLAVLHHLTAALARARTYQAVASVIIHDAIPALSAEVGVVALLSDDATTLRNVGFEGVDAATQQAWETYPVDSPVPVADAARLDEVIIVRTREERNERYPVLAQVHGLEHGGPVTAFPLHADGRRLGVLAFCWAQDFDLDADDLTFLGTLADQCALAIERARLYELAERELASRKASEERLREANARKDDFLAMLAHELRNPLAPIRSAADVLTTARLDPALARLPQVLARQADHMKRIVDDLLDVARIARGRVSLELETLDLAEIVRATSADHATGFADAGVELVVDVQGGPLPMRADPTRISQAIANLLHNARKFTPRGRRTFVTVRRETGEGFAAIVVRDEGCGIDAALLPRLFEPFAQADATLARTGGGLGLGLALVQGLVRLHGGEVTIESDGPGTGTACTLRVPLAEAPVVAADSSPTPSSRGRNVLIVDDNADVAEMLGMVVSVLGHEVRVAHDVRDALAVMEAWEPHVVLSDLGLPDVTGFELARMVRARGGSRVPLLVAVSGYGTATDKAQAREAGFDHHVTKPVDAATLSRVLADVAL